MSNAKVITQLEEILEADAGTLSESTSLDSLDTWDSLAVISFIAYVSDEFDHVLSGDDLRDAKTVGDLIALVNAGTA